MKKSIKITLLSIGALIIIVTGYAFVIRKADNNLLEMKNFNPHISDSGKAVLVPSQFINGERFYIKMPSVTGDTLLAYGDTGGGISMVLPAVVEKENLKDHVKNALAKGFMPVKYILFNDAIKTGIIPAPELPRQMILRRYFSRVTDPFLFIPPMDDELKFISQSLSFDIFLGQNFFMGKSWTIDYIHRQIWVNTPLTPGDGVQKIGFKKNSSGENIFGHPSMVIEVNGETIDVLFDTGATLVLSESGKKVFNTTEKTLGGSFIAASIFDKWRKEHPDWKYYEKADMNRDVIEVPVVKIGNYEVGPVLFAKRPDENWSEQMIGSMDKVVKGAIGGSGLKYLKVSIDYNSELIRFEK
jgi:hypothetical protein